MSRRTSALAALALAALIGAGCSGESDDDAGAREADAGQVQAVKFAECMRENGVAGFPDPDGSGALTIDGVVNGSGIDPNDAAWQGAIEACEDLQPPGFGGPEKRSPEQQTATLAFAECIREHGVPDFPDPEPDGPPVDTNRIPSAATSRGMSLLNAAMQKCGDALTGGSPP